MLSCLVYTLSPLITFFLLNTSVSVIILSYGVISAVAVNFILVVSFMIPVTWFPGRRGIVVGVINSGFGLSPTIFSPIESYLINPRNIEPVRSNSSTTNGAFFEDEEVLENIPYCLLYLSGLYASLLTIGIILCQEKHSEDNIETSKSEETSLKFRLEETFKYLKQETLKNKDFHLLWFSRLFYLIVASNILSHWKNFIFTINKDDQVKCHNTMKSLFQFSTISACFSDRRIEWNIQLLVKNHFWCTFG